MKQIRGIMKMNERLTEIFGGTARSRLALAQREAAFAAQKASHLDAGGVY
jgi:hypothetical protein